MAWGIRLSIWKRIKLDSQVQIGKKLKCFKLTIIIKFNYKTKNYKKQNSGKKLKEKPKLSKNWKQEFEGVQEKKDGAENRGHRY